MDDTKQNDTDVSENCSRPDDAYDDEGRCIRPAFLDRKNNLTIFQDHLGRQSYIDRNRYVLEDGVWKSQGLLDCRDVIVRDGKHDFWEVVPDAETAALRDRLYPETPA